MTSFAPIPGLPEGYIADSDGNLYSPNQQLNPFRARGGVKDVGRAGRDHLCIAYYVDGKPKRIFAHRAVFSAFHGPIPAGVIIRHLNGDAVDNRLKNLSPGTPADNAADAIRHGTFARGVAKGVGKLTDSDVRRIRTEYETGKFRYRDLAVTYGVDPSMIGLVVRREKWAHVV